MIAAILESGELERALDRALAARVRRRGRARGRAALATFGALGVLLDDACSSARGARTRRRTWPTPAVRRSRARWWSCATPPPRSSGVRIWACAAAVEATGADRAAVEARLDGVMSTPRFLREVAGARARRRMRRRGRVALRAVALAGCGTPSPDLFEVKRSGADRNANVTVVVNDGGQVSCNGKQPPARRRPPARAPAQVLRDLEPQAELHLELPRGRGSRAVLPRADGGRHGRVLGHLAREPAELPRARRVHQGRDRARVRAGAVSVPGAMSERRSVRDGASYAGPERDDATPAPPSARVAARRLDRRRRGARRCWPRRARRARARARPARRPRAPRADQDARRPHAGGLHAAAPGRVLRRRRPPCACCSRPARRPTPTPTTRPRVRPLHSATAAGDHDAVRALLEAGADPNVAPAGRLHAAAGGRARRRPGDGRAAARARRRPRRPPPTTARDAARDGRAPRARRCSSWFA